MAAVAGSDSEISWNLTQSDPPPGADATFWPEQKQLEQKSRQEAKKDLNDLTSPPEREPGPEADAWAAGLRGGSEDNASADPLVFGKPKPRARKPSKGEATRAPEIVLVQREELQAEVNCWEAGLRGGEEKMDAMVFSNPHFRKGKDGREAKAEARPPRSPSKPKALQSPMDSPVRPRSPALAAPKPKALRSPQPSARLGRVIRDVLDSGVRLGG